LNKRFGYITVTKNGTEKLPVNIRGIQNVTEGGPGALYNPGMRTGIHYLDGKTIYVSETIDDVLELINSLIS
jgi:hypothetical protein